MVWKLFKGLSTSKASAIDNSKTTDFDDDTEELRLQSQAVRQSSSGKLSVDIALFSKSKKFKNQLEVLKEIENNYRERNGLPLEN